MALYPVPKNALEAQRWIDSARAWLDGYVGGRSEWLDSPEYAALFEEGASARAALDAPPSGTAHAVVEAVSKLPESMYRLARAIDPNVKITAKHKGAPLGDAVTLANELSMAYRCHRTKYYAPPGQPIRLTGSQVREWRRGG